MPPHFPPDVSKAAQAALSRAQELARVDLAEFIRSMTRRLHRDVRTTPQYYRALKKEMIKRLQHPTLGKSQKAERAAKIQALPEEASRKIEDLGQKDTIRLTVRPAGAVRLLVGAVQVMLAIQYRKLQRGISVFWNAVTRAFDPLVWSDAAPPPGRFTAGTPAAASPYAAMPAIGRAAVALSRAKAAPPLFGIRIVRGDWPLRGVPGPAAQCRPFHRSGPGAGEC